VDLTWLGLQAIETPTLEVFEQALHDRAIG